jgi:hypothetical protein
LDGFYTSAGHRSDSGVKGMQSSLVGLDPGALHHDNICGTGRGRNARQNQEKDENDDLATMDFYQQVCSTTSVMSEKGCCENKDCTEQVIHVEYYTNFMPEWK